MEQLYKAKEYIVDNESLSGSLFKVLAYFDVFSYPLTADEIHEYCDLPGAEFLSVKFELDIMAQEGRIHKKEKYYFLGSEDCVAKREHANRYSPILYRKSRFYIRLIAMFPFVRCICISGSLSKNNADELSDVDYFIITGKDRLWICRTLLAVFKKIFLLNSSKYFCINYFVDEANLEIMDKNIFTATEIAFLVPVYGPGMYTEFMSANNWYKDYYPSRKYAPVEIRPGRNNLVKRMAEYLMGGKTGNAVDNALMNLHRWYRKRKFREMEWEAFARNMMAAKGVSKHHPQSFRDRVLARYQETLAG